MSSNRAEFDSARENSGFSAIVNCAGPDACRTLRVREHTYGRRTLGTSFLLSFWLLVHVS